MSRLKNSQLYQVVGGNDPYFRGNPGSSHIILSNLATMIHIFVRDLGRNTMQSKSPMASTYTMEWHFGED